MALPAIVESFDDEAIERMTREPIRPAPEPAYQTILVPLDGSELAAGAMPTAGALAARFGATIHTVTVQHAHTDVARARAQAAALLGTNTEDPRIHVEVSHEVAGAVHERARSLGACLLCMSTHGRDRVADAVIGSVARDVVEFGHEPVVGVGPFLARPDGDAPLPAPPLGPPELAACVDGTSESERWLPIAAAWARALGMRLTLVTVAEPSPAPLREGEPWHRHHGPQTDADEYMQELAGRWAAEAPGVEGRVVYDPIGPAEGMKTYLRDHPTGLVAVASYLRSGFDRIVLGAAAAEIIRLSTAPALVVPLV